MRQEIHESFAVREDVTIGSERAFGVVMAAAFALISAVSWWRSGTWWPWTIAVAALFLAATLVHPPLLRPLNIAWFRFGLLLHRVVNPIVMGALFALTVTPMGLAVRALRVDLLRLKSEPGADSYWIIRSPPGPSPETMKDQF